MLSKQTKKLGIITSTSASHTSSRAWWTSEFKWALRWTRAKV